jgi:hypothetical protein
VITLTHAWTRPPESRAILILPTWALQQFGSYLGCTCRDANIVAMAAKPITFDRALQNDVRAACASLYETCAARRRDITAGA